ncbi:MAG: hypothetical protein ACFFD4_06285 [Candidatus Odinarchaeota archaeon]
MVSCALMYVIFDEDQGPVLRAIATHNIVFPRVILRGVFTTLFTIALIKTVTSTGKIIYA